MIIDLGNDGGIAPGRPPRPTGARSWIVRGPFFTATVALIGYGLATVLPRSPIGPGGGPDPAVADGGRPAATAAEAPRLGSSIRVPIEPVPSPARVSREIPAPLAVAEPEPAPTWLASSLDPIGPAGGAEPEGGPESISPGFFEATPDPVDEGLAAASADGDVATGRYFGDGGPGGPSGAAAVALAGIDDRLFMLEERSNPRFADLKKRLRIFGNEESKQRDNVRRAVEHRVEAARKRGDPEEAGRLERQLEVIDAGGELPDIPSTRNHLRAIREEEDRLHVAFDLAEEGYLSGGEPERADRIRAIREAFLDAQNDTEDGRLLRSAGLARRGRYAVLLDAETASARMYFEADRRYRFASELYAEALAILRNDAAMKVCHDTWQEVFARLRHNVREQRDPRLNKNQRQYLKQSWNTLEARRVELEKQWNILYNQMPSPATREKIEHQLMQRLGLLQETIDELAPVMKRVRERYAEIHDPSVRECLERSDLKLGPSERFTSNATKLSKAAREMKTMKVDLRIRVHYPQTLVPL